MKLRLAIVLLLLTFTLASTYVAAVADTSSRSSGELAPALVTNTDCENAVSRIGAVYSLTTSTGSKSSIEYWRDKDRVMYTFAEKQIADQWTLTKNGYLKPTRYFLGDERAIEYDIFDINRGRGSRAWNARANLITQAQLDRMQLMQSSGSGCTRVEIYSGADSVADSRISSYLIWMPEFHLVYRYEQDVVDVRDIRNRQKYVWQLKEKFLGQSRIEDAFLRYQSFGATDYADIGDNESDPFLMKMIRLGFVQHGASGVYDSQGNTMGLHQGHVHGFPVQQQRN